MLFRHSIDSPSLPGPWRSWAPGPLLFFRYHVAVAGSTTPMLVIPSPFQSPTTGSQPGAPKANGAISGAPPVRGFFRYQTPSGLTTPGLARPSPSQSPATGVQPAPPDANGA